MRYRPIFFKNRYLNDYSIINGIYEEFYMSIVHRMGSDQKRSILCARAT